MKVQVSEWSAKQNPVIQEFTELSEHMLRFSSARDALATDLTDENKGIFMGTAQDICNEAKRIAKVTQPLIDGCTDARLKAQLSKQLEHLNSLTQQFKILSAVKASSSKDADREAQLIVCAKNITRCGKSIISDCHSASMRQREGLPHIVFKEALYRRK